ADMPDVVPSKTDGSVSVTPGANNVKLTISYKDEDGKDQTITAVKDPNGTWKLEGNVPKGTEVTPTGTVKIPQDNVKDGSNVTATGTNSSNNTATDTDKAGTDSKNAGVDNTDGKGVVSTTPIDEGQSIVTTVKLNNNNGNDRLSLTRTGTTIDDDFGTETYSNGVTKNPDGTLKVPAGVTEFTITTPVKEDNKTEGSESVKYTIGGVAGNDVTVNDTSTNPVTAYTDISRIKNINSGNPITGQDLVNRITNYDRGSETEIRRIGVKKFEPYENGSTDYMNPAGSVLWSENTSSTEAARDIFKFTEDSNGYLFAGGSIGGDYTYVGVNLKNSTIKQATYSMTSKDDVVVVGKSFVRIDNGVQHFNQDNQHMELNTFAGNDFILVGGSNPNVNVVRSTESDSAYYDLTAKNVVANGMSADVGKLNDAYYTSGITEQKSPTSDGGRILRGKINSGEGNDTLLVEGMANKDSYSVEKSTIDMGDGNDRVVIYNSNLAKVGKLSESTIDLGAGDDYISLSGLENNSSISGSAGYDILDFKGTGTLDFTFVKGIEEVKLSGGTLKANFADVSTSGLESSLKINGTGTVDLDITNQNGATRVEDNISYKVYTNGSTEILIQDGIVVV
ncbi:TPA: hypothetical protein ACK3JW_000001, partial [Mannheimia haemolytica]